GYFVLLTWMPIYFQTVCTTLFQCGAMGNDGVFKLCSWCDIRSLDQSRILIDLSSKNHATKTPRTTLVILTTALSLSSFSQAGFLLNIQDIAPHCAGLLHGIANSIGTLAAITSTIGAGIFVQCLGSFQAFLTLTAVLYFGSSIFYNLHATGERVF
ncbi:hypothetical protein Droror1_Dr00027098, partial [Drosera rotundifolia]